MHNALAPPSDAYPVSRLALITGAAHGIGRAIADRLAADGHELLLADIQGDAVERAAAELVGAGYAASHFVLDVGNEAAALEMYGQIERRFGRLDVLVNNAGVTGERAPVQSTTLQGWQRTLRTNLTSAFLMSRGAIPLMKRGRWGRIVNVSSLSARGQPGVQRCGYVASKAGVLGLSRVLADEVGRDGITVNCVAPSRIRTPLTIAVSGDRSEYWQAGIDGSVLKRLGTSHDVARAVSWLCSDCASFVTGCVLDVNGGTMMR
jgi:3-oxoacyl-[acyl-carrier protein] reductase